MKRSLLIIITVLLSWQCYTQTGQNIPGPVTIRKAGKFITLDVTDSSMIDLNNRIKLYQTGDTLYILTKTHILLAKFAPDTVRFSTGPGYSGGGSGEIDSLGNPFKYWVMTWTEPNKIGGNNNFIYKSDSVFTMNVIQGSDRVSIKSDMQDAGTKNYIAFQSYDATNAKSASINVQTENTYSDVTLTSNWFRANTDSSRIDGDLRLMDSVRLAGYENVTRYAYLYRDSINGALKLDSSIITATYGLTMPLIDVDKILSNLVNGEIAWPLSATEFTHNVDTLRMNEKFRVLFARAELDLRLMSNLKSEIKTLRKASNIKDYILFVVLILFTFLILKSKKS